MTYMNTKRPIPADGAEIVRLAIEWYNASLVPGLGEGFLRAEDRLRDALATRPECYSPQRPVVGSLDSSPGPVDAVKTCPGASPPAGSLERSGDYWPEPSLRDIAKGTTGYGDDE